MPILIHAGRGLPPLGDELVEITLRHPDVVLILAHGAICDQGIITSRLADHPGVLYDISCFFPLDVIELLARAPIERIVFASDPPYGLPASSLYMALRVAAHAGLDEDAVRGMLGGTIAGLFDGHGPAACHSSAAWSLDHTLRPPRAGVWIWQPGGSCDVHGIGRASPGDARHGARGLPRPRPGRCRRGARDDRAALSAAGALLELQSEDGMRAAIDLVYRASIRAATELLDRG